MLDRNGPIRLRAHPLRLQGRMKHISLAFQASRKGVSMQKLRCSLAAIALVATLSGSILLQGMGAGAMANAASSRHVSSVSSTLVVGKSTGSVAFRPYTYCPGATTVDC